MAVLVDRPENHAVGGGGHVHKERGEVDLLPRRGRDGDRGWVASFSSGPATTRRPVTRSRAKPSTFVRLVLPLPGLPRLTTFPRLHATD